MNSSLNSILVLALLTSSPLAAESLAQPQRPVDYNRDIRPLLADNCFACHGPDSAARKADLRLDRYEDAIAPRKDSSPAIVPGKPEESSFIERIVTHDPDDIMPPPKTQKSLRPHEIDLLKRWIASGAQYQQHWSLLPPQRPPLPPVQKTDWPRTPIDAFILAELESAGLAPASEADRATLARRLSLDLTGLPPSPELVQTFISDPTPNAYEKLVDQLLNSLQYGEHRARYWLDAARYADTHGIHFDNFREMWSYREWVIRAFNQNMPFDQFTIEQLAGDLLPDPTLEQRIATGFNRCNMTTNEGGAIEEEYRVLYARDRTETTSQVWLGFTANCATCHDHKFDPLTQREFYEMSAFFNNTTQPIMDGNKRDTPPVLVVPTITDRPRWEELPKVKATAQSRIDRRRDTATNDYKTWIAATSPASFLAGLPVDGLEFVAPLTEESSPSILIFSQGSPRLHSLPAAPPAQEGVISAQAFTTSPDVVPAFPELGNFNRDQAFSAGLWLRLHPEDKNGSILSRMDETDGHRGWDLWIQDGKPGVHLVHKWPDDAIKVLSRKAIEPGQWTHLFITYDGSGKAGGVNVFIDGEQQNVERPVNKLQNSTLANVPFKIGQRNTSDHVDKAGVQDVRLYSRALKAEDIRALRNKPRLSYLASKTEDQRTEPETKALYEAYLNGFDPEFLAALQAFAALEQEERDIKSRGTVAHVMHEKNEPPAAYLLFRGEYDKRRDPVTANTPKALPPFPTSFPRNRLGFAQWLLMPENPLTARVTVNRFWQELFGSGLVKTAGDFGISGDLPSHPDLLDWLAVEFRESNWNIKRLYKLIVMSSAYRQDAVITPEKLAKDPQNRLLSRGPRFRMDAEMVRDYALAASGILSPKIGGPSVKPYQPDGVWEMVAMLESDTHKYKRDEGEKLYRRSLYTFWKRSAPPAFMDIFNAPTREVCTVRRERTNTPLQALATLNDPQLIEAARHLAQQCLQEKGDAADACLDALALRLLARPFKPDERRVIEGVLADLKAHYKAAPEEALALIQVGESKPDPKLDPPLLAAYTMVANQLLNLDEVLNK